MYTLYNEQCTDHGKTPAPERVYRTVFCERYNLSFHRPRKHKCMACNAYNMAQKSGEMNERTQSANDEHQRNKIDARAEKDHDKAKAKEDPS